MSNANSLYNKFSRYVGGGTSEQANGKIEWWERNEFPTSNTDIVYVVENFYEGRLDLISAVFYNEPRWWWIIAQYNNILDPFGEIIAGRTLLIPSKDRIQLMISKKQGGINSTKQPVNTISPVVI